jgi:hypothetical protein
MVLLSWLLACGGGVECREPGQVLAEAGGDALVCADASAVVGWIELLAGREVSRAERSTAAGALAAEFREDPVATRALVSQVRADGSALAALTGLAGAEARAGRVWHADHGDDLLRPEHGSLWNLQAKAMSVWSKDEEEQLAVTESDLEAWIRYASLCREVQGATTLRVSVGDRVTIYQQLISRFDQGDRATQIGVAAFGPVWTRVTERWKAASYERQQSFVSAAPLPPPMSATSMAYAEAVFAGDLAGHARAVHDTLGPFALGDAARFTAEPPTERGTP